MTENWKEEIITNKLGGKREWSEHERVELAHQLDKELNEHLDSLPERKPVVEDRWTEENWREKIAEHPIFSPYIQDNEKQNEAPLNELSEGLAQLKYDAEFNSPSEVAQSYKEEGVHYFKYKKYNFAIASFTEGLKAQCPDKNLNAQLFNNRAAAHFYLKNYRSALNDCERAIKLKSNYEKAILRAVQCATSLKSWNEVIAWCDKGMIIASSNDYFSKQRIQAVKEKKKLDRDQRRKAVEERRKEEDEIKLLKAINERGINLYLNSENLTSDDSSPITVLQPSHLVLKQSRVHFNSSSELVWPVLFLYPEYNESDCIFEFSESSRFIDHVGEMFGPDVPAASWDTCHKYRPENLAIYFKDRSSESLVNVKMSSTLKDVLSDKRFEVREGTPTFLLLVKNSDYEREYLNDYGQ